MARIQDDELNALRNILKTLEPFTPAARERILTYTYSRCQSGLDVAQQEKFPHPKAAAAEQMSMLD